MHFYMGFSLIGLLWLLVICRVTFNSPVLLFFFFFAFYFNAMHKCRSDFFFFKRTLEMFSRHASWLKTKILKQEKTSLKVNIHASIIRPLWPVNNLCYNSAFLCILTLF